MAVIEIPDLSQMEVVFDVHEIDQDKIVLGRKVKLTLEAFPEQTFEAQVREVARLAEAVNEKSQVKNFTVKAAIENNDAILKPGMTAKVRVILNQYNDVIAIPCTAVLEKEGQPVVFTAKKWPQSTSIKLGARNNHFVIVESGLQAGDKIAWPVPIAIVDNLHQLGYKQKIQRELEETNWVTKNLEEMKQKGLDFDYATFRQHKAKGTQTKNDSMNLDVRKGILKMPDGRVLSLPDEVLEKMKSSGGNIMMKALQDPQKPQKKMGAIKSSA
ncbi:MAG: efflux RND transporter periplasmic adaptor subunit [bacterium]